jgi:predicted enzyme related to lactoylglutathione lyase
MKNKYLIISGFLASFAIGILLNSAFSQKNLSNAKEKKETKKVKNMKLGAFSMSLSVKDLTISKEFYEKLGFTVFAGSMESKYLIMKNENALIGLFQGMFEGNILTFNPGWDENAKNVKKFDDIRDIQKQLKNSGLTLIMEADEKTTGPASLMLSDPDGNMILIDQHR